MSIEVKADQKLGANWKHKADEAVRRRELMRRLFEGVCKKPEKKKKSPMETGKRKRRGRAVGELEGEKISEETLGMSWEEYVWIRDGKDGGGQPQCGRRRGKRAEADAEAVESNSGAVTRSRKLCMLWRARQRSKVQKAAATRKSFNDLKINLKMTTSHWNVMKYVMKCHEMIWNVLKFITTSRIVRPWNKETTSSVPSSAPHAPHMFREKAHSDARMIKTVKGCHTGF